MKKIEIRMDPISAQWKGGGQIRPTLPQRIAWLESPAAAAFMRLQAKCGNSIILTDAYRPIEDQIRLKNDPAKAKFAAPPGRSAHAAGFAVDVAVQDTLNALKKSADAKIRAWGSNLDTLRALMMTEGFAPISSETWHFSYWPGYKNEGDKRDKLYGAVIASMSKEDLQEAANLYLDKRDVTDIEPLKIDGKIGEKSIAALDRCLSIAGVSEGNRPGIIDDPESIRRYMAWLVADIQFGA